VPEHKAVSFREALRVWLRIGLLGFGGPAGQIALMHRIVVDEKRWVGEQRFLHALNYCMLLPGPEAQQLAVYLGWLLHRTAGGLAAGILFVLPGAILILTLSILYAAYQQQPAVAALFFGVKAAVVAVVIEALIRIGKRALKNRFMICLAIGAFMAIFFFNTPFPVVILTAALIGAAGVRLDPEIFTRLVPAGHAAQDPARTLLQDDGSPQPMPSLVRAIRITAVSLLLWFAPVLGFALWQGSGSIFVTQALFYSKMAMVTFGGAYAVLAYVAQQAVEHYAWLDAHQMLDGLGLAETTPGPLILVLQFVGYLSAYRQPGLLDPVLAGVLGAMLTTWVTFVPCFFWIFLGAPYIEALRGKASLDAALGAITAAVTGVIASLAVWFGLHVIFGAVQEAHVYGVRLYVPVWDSFEPAAAVLAMASLAALLRFRIGMIPTLAVSTVLGMAYFYFMRGHMTAF